MSEEVQTEEEPSIEEILDSIRQIISEDEEEEEEEAPAAVEAEPKAKPEPVAQEEPLDQSAIDDMDFDAPFDEDPEPEPEDVFELTELVDPESNNLDVDLVAGEDSEEEPEADDWPEPEPEPEAEPEAVEEEPVIDDAPRNDPDDDTLFTQTAESAAMSAISNLVRKTSVGRGSLTLEDIVRAELKPLLREWLDKHLPTVIERLVQEELERISKRVLEE
ncbi:MAG: DUF2497 domain-containing protein [Alphaproteobacteria bacterium]